MSEWEVVTAVTGIAGVVVALGAGGVALRALGTAKNANSLAQKSNKLSKGANSIATDALGQAAEANNIAQDANKLGEDANALAKRAVLQQDEDWYVNWTLQWDEKDATLKLRNLGARTAHDLTVIITNGEVHHVSEGLGDVNPGLEIFFEVPEIPQYRELRGQIIRYRQRNLARKSQIMTSYSWAYECKIIIRWRTGAGFPASMELNKELR